MCRHLCSVSSDRYRSDAMIMMSDFLWRTFVVTKNKVEEIKKRTNVETFKTLRKSEEEIVPLPLLGVMLFKTVHFNT